MVQRCATVEVQYNGVGGGGRGWLATPPNGGLRPAIGRVAVGAVGLRPREEIRNVRHRLQTVYRYLCVPDLATLARIHASDQPTLHHSSLDLAIPQICHRACGTPGLLGPVKASLFCLCSSPRLLPYRWVSGLLRYQRALGVTGAFDIEALWLP